MGLRAVTMRVGVLGVEGAASLFSARAGRCWSAASNPSHGSVCSLASRFSTVSTVKPAGSSPGFTSDQASGVATPAPGTGYLAGLQFASAATVADMMWFPPDMAYLAVFHFVRQQ